MSDLERLVAAMAQALDALAARVGALEAQGSRIPSLEEQHRAKEAAAAAKAQEG
jgi:hypothetical protein